jgi:hypothetical protein
LWPSANLEELLDESQLKSSLIVCLFTNQVLCALSR